MKYSESEFLSYKKSNVQVEEETPIGYGGIGPLESTSPDFVEPDADIPEDFDSRLELFLSMLMPLFQECSEMSLYMERMIRYLGRPSRTRRRQDANAVDMMRYALVLDKMAEISDCTLPDCDACSIQSSGLNTTSEKLQQISVCLNQTDISASCKTRPSPLTRMYWRALKLTES